jgi:hypothetical protein
MQQSFDKVLKYHNKRKSIYDHFLTGYEPGYEGGGKKYPGIF